MKFRNLLFRVKNGLIRAKVLTHLLQPVFIEENGLIACFHNRKIGENFMKLSKFMKFMKNVKFIILRGGGLSLSYVGPPWASHKLPRQSPRSMKSPSWSSSFAFLPVVLGFRNVVRGFSGGGAWLSGGGAWFW